MSEQQIPNWGTQKVVGNLADNNVMIARFLSRLGATRSKQTKVVESIDRRGKKTIVVFYPLGPRPRAEDDPTLEFDDAA